MINPFDYSDTAVALINQFTTVLDLTGVLINGLVSGVIAKRARLDITGCMTLGLVGATGGGLFRDLILAQGPPVAFTNLWYLPLGLLGGVLAFLVSHGSWVARQWEKNSIYIDALVLGLWSVAGAQKAIMAGMPWLQSVVLGVVTAVGGGILRDVLLRQRPRVFGGYTLYITPSIVVSAFYVTCVELVAQPWAVPAFTLASIVIAGIFVPLAAKKNWKLSVRH